MITLELIKKYSENFESLGLGPLHQETIAMICCGLNTKEMSIKSNIAIKSVKFRVTKIHKKLGTKNKVQVLNQVIKICSEQFNPKVIELSAGLKC